MLNLHQRTELLSNLQQYILSDNTDWNTAKERASHYNAWFTPAFIDVAIQQIAQSFLDAAKLQQWITEYRVPAENEQTANVGITMAGNIPLVGFHDFLCTFIQGHKQTIKLSSKDNVLLKHLVEKMTEWNSEVSSHVEFRDLLKGCDAYIATGSNNSARYFEYYFRKYPHIIRKNRTSVAIIKGTESNHDLENLADDICMYFGLGCRSVTKIFVPADYDFIPLLEALKKYDAQIENHKYKHNYDFNLAMHIVNQKFYMTNGSIILSENQSVFSAISQLNYQFYNDTNEIYAGLNPEEIQCIAGSDKLPFGFSQAPQLNDYADGIDTMLFLKNLYK
ncbi:MAG: acyl-CoA reductase [Agriterribacter sp.]